ncbi:Fic family protein [Hymenobacter busanensis]|nr:Fic family protein [Hymenobacter busanensis]QHJ09155.1 Fic family protein [Hymenobacter busanensis]
MTTYSDELLDQLARIDALQQQIDALRPLPADVQARIFQKFRLDWNYHSNSIEGNSLTYGETVAFIMEGVTAKGKPLKDHLDLRGHNQGIDVLLDIVKNPEAELTERDIRELHHIIMVEPYAVMVDTAAGPQRHLVEPGQYKTMPNHTLTATGETHFYATPEETPARMHDLLAWYRTHRDTLHPLVLAALFHHKFVAIHPFDDGNGRMTRLLTNLLLMKAGYPPVVVKTEEKREYYAVLSQADAGLNEPLLTYFAESLIRSLEIYLKGAKGKDFTEPDDLDKRIALLKRSFTTEDYIKETINPGLIRNLFANSIFNLCKAATNKSEELSSLFSSTKFFYIFNTTAGRHTFSDTGELASWLWDGPYERAWPLQSFEFQYAWLGFKKSIEPFDIHQLIDINFSLYKYKIKIDRGREIEISKFYHQPLTQSEGNEIISAFINSAIDKIQSITKV